MSYFELEHIIHGTDPGHGDIDVPVNKVISIQFTRSMFESSLNSDTVILRNDDNRTEVSHTLSYNDSTHTLTITPDDDFDANTMYSVELRGASDETEVGRSGIVDIFGNIMFRNFNFYFRTTSLSILDAPTLVTPDNQSSVATTGNITFSWSTITGADHYEIQVCKNEDFLEIYWPEAVGDWDPTQTSIQPNKTFTQECEYYWRVRAVDASGNTSDWSDVYTFYYGNPQDLYVSPEDVPIPGVTAPSSSVVFYNSKPAAGMSNIPLNRLNSIEIVLDGYVASGYIVSDRIYVYSESIDGHRYFSENVTGYSGDGAYYEDTGLVSSDYFPMSAADPYSSIETSGEMNATISSSYDGRYTTITITPDSQDYYKVNNRYFVTINVPGLQGFFWFTSRYEPLMTTINSVRSSALGLLDEVSDDVINYTIRYKSLDAIDQAMHPEWDDGRVAWANDHTCPFDVNNPPRYVREYVKWATIMDILNSKVINSKISGDVSKELGDLSISRKPPYDWGKQHKELLHTFEKKRQFYENWIHGKSDPGWTRPGYVIRNANRPSLRRRWYGRSFGISSYDQIAGLYPPDPWR